MVDGWNVWSFTRGKLDMAINDIHSGILFIPDWKVRIYSLDSDYDINILNDRIRSGL